MRLKITLMASLSGVLVLSACAPGGAGSGPAPDAAQVRSAEGAGSGACEPGKEVWRSPGPPTRGGTLVRAVSGFDHLDMTKPGLTALGATPQVYNSLIRFRGCFPSDTAMVPSLARAWEISPDGRAWTFKLRDDVKWQNRPPVNGRSFTSADVGKMIDLQKKEGVLRTYWIDVTNEQPDDHTVVLRTAEPQADLLGKVGAPANVIMPQEIREAYGDFKSVAVGTGAFMVKSFKPGQEVVLEPNPDYYENGDDGKRLPYLDEVRAIFFGDTAAELAALRAGRIDSTTTFGLRKLDADALRQSQPKMRPWEMRAFAPQALWFNLSRKPFDDVRVRRAAALAIDVDDLIAVNRGGAGYNGYVPVSLTEYAWPHDKLRQKFKADPERARRLLAEAGFPSGTPEFELFAQSSGAEEAEVVQRHLEAVGLRSKITVIPGTFTATWQKRDYDLAWSGIGGVLFPGYWAGDLIRTGSPLNYMMFSDPELDKLADAQAREMDPVRRKHLIDQIQDRLYDLMLYYPPINRAFYHFVSCRVRNHIQIQPGYNSPAVLYAWIDTAGC